ncbi:MAG TPA: DUF6602 domain-containing protein [Polyangiaceae bacterium]
MSRARACARVDHAGLKGTLREIVVGDLLRPLLPSDVGIGTGKVISYDDQTSRQHDIIIYDRSILPPIIFEGGAGLFPVESVAYTIEIKSTLSAGELRTAHDSALALAGLPYTSGERDYNDEPIVHDLIKTISAVFAFGTDLVASSELARYETLLSGSAPALKSICVAGAGFWDHHNRTGWNSVPAGDLDEVVQFVGQLGNSFRRVLDTRGKPRIGLYLR